MSRSLNEHEIRPPDLMKISSKLHDRDLLMFKKDKMIKVNCPACTSSDYCYLFTKKKFEYVSCNKCLTVFINPRPSQKSLEIFYKSSESMAFWDKIYQKTEMVRKEKIFRPRIKIVKKILKKYNIKNCNKLIEVGCGYGWFCELAREQKLANKIVAIEPSPSFASSCRKIRGIKVIQSTIEKYGHKLDSDIIVNFELIEHLFSPRTFLDSCYKGLRAGGVFICSTPNFYGLDILILKEKSDNVNGPNHLNYFNPTSIELLLKSVGFRNIDVITPGLMDVQIIVNKIRVGELKAKDYPFFGMLIEHGKEDFINEFQSLIQKYKMSSHMVVSAQK